jgi:hypothetical protein
MIALAVLLIPTAPAADPAPKDVRAAVEKSLPFLEKSSAAWRADRKCVTCHQVPFTIWALNDAKARGLAVDAARLDDLTGWAFDFCTTAEHEGQKTGGFHLTMVDIVLSQTAAAPRDDAGKAYARFETLFAKRQKPDGSWREGNQVKLAGAEREADEVDTMWTLLALRALDRLGDKLPPDTRKGLAAERDKALGFLRDARPGKRIDWLALRMMVAQEYETPAKAAELLKELRGQQGADGGWGYVRAGASYPHTTGEVLYALSRTGVPADDPVVRRAAKYLLDTQQPDGSWKALSRQAFSTKPDKMTPISVHWGTAWATIGLLSTLPK